MCDATDWAWGLVLVALAWVIVALGVIAIVGAVREGRRGLVHVTDAELTALAPWLAGATGATQVEWSRTLVEGLVEQLNNGRRAR